MSPQMQTGQELPAVKAYDDRQIRLQDIFLRLGHPFVERGVHAGHGTGRCEGGPEPRSSRRRSIASRAQCTVRTIVKSTLL